MQISVKMCFNQACCTLIFPTHHGCLIISVRFLIAVSDATFTELVGAKRGLVEITREICSAKLPVRCKTKTSGHVFSQRFNTKSANGPFAAGVT